METEMYAPVICQAIKRHNLLQFSYDFVETTVEPYAYGTTRGQREVLRAYQVASGSLSDEPQGWKMFVVVEMYQLTVLDDKFTNLRAGYTRNDKALHRVFCQV
jgi:hypothetical protein